MVKKKAVHGVLDISAIFSATQELEAAIRAYDCGSGPNLEWWGVVVACLWKADRALNPSGLKYGVNRRDEHFGRLPILQSGPLSRIRRVVDDTALMFRLGGALGPESQEGILAKAREVAAGMNHQPMSVDRRWAEELLSAAQAIKPAERTPAPRLDSELSKEALAIAALKDHPEWSHAEIAKAAGCHKHSLYRFKGYMAARELLSRSKESSPRGYKASDGTIEAWENE